MPLYQSLFNEKKKKSITDSAMKAIIRGGLVQLFWQVTFFC